MHILLMGGLAAALAGTGAFQDLDALDARIASVLGTSGSAMPVDRRIKLAACPAEPTVTRAAGGSLSVRCPAIGWKIRVPVAGAEVTDAAAAPVVHRGDTIELVVQGPGYSASSVGTALDEGAAGSVIRVRIPTSGAPLSAIISRAGVATVSD